MLAELGGVLVVPMTLLRQEYRDEIFGGLAARRIPVRHVLLAPEETILRERIATRQEPGEPQDVDLRVRQWAYDHIPVYQQALGWLTADAHVIDNGNLTPRETAERIADAVRSETARVCDIVQTPEPTRETVAAGVLLFDEQDRVLLVDPTYKAGWEFPGGVVEAGEAPACAGVREVAEELGLVLDRVPGLLVVDWEPPQPPGYGGLRLLFDGGRRRRPGSGCRARNCGPGASSRSPRPPASCRSTVTNAWAGPCAPGNADARCTWRRVPRSAEPRRSGRLRGWLRGRVRGRPRAVPVFCSTGESPGMCSCEGPRTGAPWTRTPAGGSGETDRPFRKASARRPWPARPPCPPSEDRRGRSRRSTGRAPPGGGRSRSHGPGPR